MIRSNVDLCVTLVLLSRAHRGFSKEDSAARDTYADAFKSVCATRGVTGKDIDIAMQKVYRTDCSKPTVKMAKVAA